MFSLQCLKYSVSISVLSVHYRWSILVQCIASVSMPAFITRSIHQSPLIKIASCERRIPLSIRSINSQSRSNSCYSNPPSLKALSPRKTRVSFASSSRKTSKSVTQNPETKLRIFRLLSRVARENKFASSHEGWDLDLPRSSSHLCGLPANFFTPPSCSPLMVRGSLYTVRAIMTLTSYSRAGVGVLLLDPVVDFYSFVSIHNRAASSTMNIPTRTVTQSKMRNLCWLADMWFGQFWRIPIEIITEIWIRLIESAMALPSVSDFPTAFPTEYVLIFIIICGKHEKWNETQKIEVYVMTIYSTGNNSAKIRYISTLFHVLKLHIRFVFFFAENLVEKYRR